MENKGNLVNLLYLFSLPSPPQIKIFVDRFDSVEALKEKSSALEKKFAPAEGQYLNFILRGYDRKDQLVQVGLVMTYQDNDLLFHIQRAEEAVQQQARKAGLDPADCTLAVKGFIGQETYLCDLIKGRYKDVKTKTEVLRGADFFLQRA